MSKFQFGEAHKDQTKANEKAESAVNTSKDSTSGKVVDNKDVGSTDGTAGAISSELVVGSTGPIATDANFAGGFGTTAPGVTVEGTGTPPLAQPKLDSHVDFFSQSTKAVTSPSPEGIAKAGGTVKNAVVNKIEAAVPFVGQERQSGEHRFQVQLEGEPAEEVFAKDRLEAQQRYSARLGIISTIKAFRISQVD